MNEFRKPEYRVRLFLSVDLTGSTNFKSKSGQSNLDWLKAFQKFYGEFPVLFSNKYTEICGVTEDIGEREEAISPKVWKTIGDEIIFVNRVDSITHLGAYVKAFSTSLIEFGEMVETTYGLNTKGNGWLAAFPSPNCSIQLSKTGSRDPFSGEFEVLTEDFELEVDQTPHDFDFLGKGIDGGFRISRNSTIDTFTISPALAFLLCKAKRNKDTTKFDCDFLFHEPQIFKGVVGEKPYPIVSIDTNRDPQLKKIYDLQAELLQKPVVADSEILSSYLEKYIKHHKIEMPSLKLSSGNADIDPPEHYKCYIKQLEGLDAELREQTIIETDSLTNQPTQEARQDGDTQSAVHALQSIVDRIFGQM